MERFFLDTNVIIRHITGDNPDQSQRSRSLLRQAEAGELALVISESIVVEAVQVLSSRNLYRVPRDKVAHDLSVVIELRGVQLPAKRTYLRALELWAASSTAIDFVDALNVAHAEQRGITTIVSFDHNFDRFPQITRREP